MKNNELLLLLEQIHDFEQYCNVVKNLTNKEKGDAFEIITYYTFKLSPVLNHNLTDIWLYKDIPQKIKDKLKLPKKDKGIDLLLVKGGEYYAMQSKAK